MGVARSRRAGSSDARPDLNSNVRFLAGIRHSVAPMRLLPIEIDLSSWFRHSTNLRTSPPMKSALAAVASIVALTSCATPSAMFVTPGGKTVRCSAQGWGYVGAPMAEQAQARCINDAKAAGMLPIEEAGYIGIQMSSDASTMQRILLIGPGSPAEKAGIKAGDFVVAINEQPVTNVTDMYRLAFGRVNTPVTVTYRSGGTEKTVTLIRAQRPGVQSGAQK